MTRLVHLPLLVLLAVSTAGCATTMEQHAAEQFATWEPEFSAESGAAMSEEPPAPDGSLDSYLVYAMRKSPELEADYERWRASVLRISSARRFPDLTVSYSVFVRAVETRVGPQRGRLGVRQSIPWPTKLTAGANAASARADAAQARFESRLLAVRSRVARAFWQLWVIHRVHDVNGDQEELLRGLAASVRSRVESGSASLADLSQVDLQLILLSDHNESHVESIVGAEANLRAAIGAPPDLPTPVDLAEPVPELPVEEANELVEAALQNPVLREFDALADASDATSERETASRYPTFGLGFDWIQIGEAVVPNLPDSGQDAFSLTVSMNLPLWQGTYADSTQAARAEASSHRADGRAMRDRIHAQLAALLSALRDTHRVVLLHGDTFIPQAEVTYRSALGEFESGRGQIADIVLAEMQLLDLEVAQIRLMAQHATLWAALEEVVGHPLTSSDEESND